MDKPSDVELAWCAGFVDGEASVDVFRGFIHIQQNQVEPLRKLQSILGGRINGPYTRTRRIIESGSPFWYWRLGMSAGSLVVASWLTPFAVNKREKLVALAERGRA